MRGITGLDLQDLLQERGDSLPIIIISGFSETPLTVRAIKNGAVTFLDKPCRSSELVDAIRDALAQDETTREKQACEKRFQEAVQSLDSREQEILELMLKGRENTAIAAALSVSVRTVENRRHNIFKKTNTTSVMQLGQVYQETIGKHQGDIFQ